VELVVSECIKRVSFEDKEKGKFAEKVFRAAGKYIEEKYNVKTQVKTYETDNMINIEFIISKRTAFYSVGEAVDTLVVFKADIPQILEDYNKMIDFYEEILREVGFVETNNLVQHKDEGENKEPAREIQGRNENSGL